VLAAGYPDRPMRMVVPYEPGGGTDIVARQLAQALSMQVGQSVVVENKPGAGGLVAMQYVARAQPDGYTVMVGQVGPLAIGPAIYKKLPIDVNKDLEPVILVGTQPLILVVNPAVPAKTLEEFVALAKAHPDEYRFSSAGNGSFSHLGGVVFEKATGAPLTHIPYNGGGPAVTDLLSGRVQATFNIIPTLRPLIDSGKVRPLGISIASDAAPDIPDVNKTYPGFDIGSWFGIVVPAHTPRAVVDKLNADVKAALKAPKIADLMKQQGVKIIADSPEDFGRFIKSEQVRWAEIVKATGASVN
jgi:tripartite-type tricarboxylate transporter receptor subunit TctC